MRQVTRGRRIADYELLQLYDRLSLYFCMRDVESGGRAVESSGVAAGTAADDRDVMVSCGHASKPYRWPGLAVRPVLCRDVRDLLPHNRSARYGSGSALTFALP